MGKAYTQAPVGQNSDVAAQPWKGKGIPLSDGLIEGISSAYRRYLASALMYCNLT